MTYNFKNYYKNAKQKVILLIILFKIQLIQNFHLNLPTFK